MKTQFKHTRLLLAILVSTAVSTAISSPSFAQDKMMKHADSMMKHTDAMEAKLGLDGYCPVCIIDAKKWEKGDPNISSTFDGVSYLFPNQVIKAKFDANPQNYVPALNGDCIVCYEKHGKRIAGNIQHAALSNGRLYLFPGDREKQMFIENSSAYASSDVAAKGECIVCLAKAGKHVPGSAQHTVIHNGLRYQFPSPAEAEVFRASPDQFINSISMMKDAGMEDVGMKKTMHDNGVRLVGRSGCAACEFGITSLSAPDELGLAVVSDDGRVTVVEGAHANYPQIYKDRFQGKQLSVEGMIVKTQGNISWLKPTSLQVIH